MDRLSSLEKEEIVEHLEREMIEAAKNLEFEKAAQLRDELDSLKRSMKNK